MNALPADDSDRPRLSVPDFDGEDYLAVLGRLHSALSPKSYFEIGTNSGNSLAIAQCRSLAVDPEFKLGSKDVVGKKELCALYQLTSDAFFESVDPTVPLGRKIDLAFLDGLHRCEFLLRDFANTEKFCKRNSIIAMHDCLPVEHLIAGRDWGDRRVEPHRATWWAGDVWRAARLLKQCRPDLAVTAIGAPPTGLVLVTHLDPTSRFIMDHYRELVPRMMAMDLEQLGVDRLHREMNLEPPSVLDSVEKITSRFWL